MKIADSTPVPAPALWPLKKAAEVAGLTPKLFSAAVSNGDMPGVELLLLGQRGRRFVRAAALMSYLHGNTPAPEPAQENSPGAA
jgi:hypothetical protein